MTDCRRHGHTWTPLVVPGQPVQENRYVSVCTYCGALRTYPRDNSGYHRVVYVESGDLRTGEELFTITEDLS